MILSVTDPRDERFLLFYREATAAATASVAIPVRIDRLAAASVAALEAVEGRAPAEWVASGALDLAGWAVSPDPAALEPWALDALHRLRRDRVRARNVARGVVDWVAGHLRSQVTELRASWQALHDSGLGYPVDPDRPLTHPALASANVAVWSYALVRAVVAQRHRGLPEVPTTLAAAARWRPR